MLRNHVIAKYLVTSEVECGYQCTRESKCLSFNYKDHSASLFHECEINDYKQQNGRKGIVGLDGFSYYEREVREHKLKRPLVMTSLIYCIGRTYTAYAILPFTFSLLVYSSTFGSFFVK